MRAIERILVVDDKPELARSIKRHLWRAGFETGSAFDGLAARGELSGASFRGTPFDLLIAGVVMPLISGMELLGWRKEHRPFTSAILISGFGANGPVMEDLPASRIGCCRPEAGRAPEKDATHRKHNRCRAALRRDASQVDGLMF